MIPDNSSDVHSVLLLLGQAKDSTSVVQQTICLSQCLFVYRHHTLAKYKINRQLDEGEKERLSKVLMELMTSNPSYPNHVIHGLSANSLF